MHTYVYQVLTYTLKDPNACEAFSSELKVNSPIKFRFDAASSSLSLAASYIITRM